MSEEFGVTLDIPSEAMKIGEVDEALRYLLDRLPGEENGIASFEGTATWDEITDATDVLERLEIAYDLHTDAKYEYDGLRIYYRPDHKNKTSLKREMLSTQDGEPTVKVSELLEFVRNRGGRVTLDDVQQAFGMPESVGEWAKANRKHLDALIREKMA